jgi:hypothetical protein
MLQVVRLLAIAAQQPGDSLLERLDPPRRAAAIMALLGLTLIGVLLITFVMVGGHWVRRLARQRPGSRTGASAAATQKLRDALRAFLPDIKSGDTIVLDTPSKDTRVEH